MPRSTLQSRRTIGVDEPSPSRTIPPDAERTDGAPRTPGQDPDVWRDHVLVARHDCPEALRRLVDEYMRYACSLANRLHRGHEAREDLHQIALEALVLALKRFDPERGIPFPAFATPTILGAIRRHYRDHGWSVKVPRRVHEMATAHRDAYERLSETLGRPPTEDEVAAEMGVDPSELDRATAAMAARRTRSLDAPVDEGRTLGETVGGPDPALELVEDRLAADEALGTLDPGDRRLLGRYYLEEKTQVQIAETMGVSQMQVSRLLRAAVGRAHRVAAA